MNKNINHWCKVCGAGYYACNECDRKIYIHWRAVACTPEHFQAYCTLHEYTGGSIDKNQAKEVLASLVDTEVMENYPEPTRGLLKEIFADEETAKKQNVKSKQKKTVETREELHEPKEEI